MPVIIVEPLSVGVLYEDDNKKERAERGGSDADRNLTPLPNPSPLALISGNTYFFILACSSNASTELRSCISSSTCFAAVSSAHSEPYTTTTKTQSLVSRGSHTRKTGKKERSGSLRTSGVHGVMNADVPSFPFHVACISSAK